MFVRNGQKLGSLLVDKTASSEPEPEAQAEQRPDGVHAVGGGWHEVVIDGQVIDKIRGAEAAQSAYDAYLQSEPDEGGDEEREADGDDDTVPA